MFDFRTYPDPDKPGLLAGRAVGGPVDGAEIECDWPELCLAVAPDGGGGVRLADADTAPRTYLYAYDYQGRRWVFRGVLACEGK